MKKEMKRRERERERRVREMQEGINAKNIYFIQLLSKIIMEIRIRNFKVFKI